MTDSRPDTNATSAGAAILATYVAGLLLSSITLLSLDQSIPWHHPLLWLPLLVALTGTWLWRQGASLPTLWTAVVTLAAALALTNLLLDLAPIRRYGDWRQLHDFLVEGEVFDRWLAGTALLNWLYSLFSSASEATPVVLEGRDSASLFLRTGALVTTAASSIVMLRRWPDRPSVILPVLTPIWMLFATGHQEYYPFVAWALIGSLAWLTDRPLKERHPIAIGSAAALLQLLYLGFAPLGALTIGAYALASRRSAILALLCAIVLIGLGVMIFWPGPISTFVDSSFTELGENWDQRPGTFAPYRGEGSSPNSIWFSWSYALSSEHLLDLALMLTMGASPPVVLLVFVGSAMLLMLSSDRVSLLREPRTLLILAWVGFQAHYFLRLLPHRGPIGDLDTHFSTYLTLAFFAGWLIEHVRKIDLLPSRLDLALPLLVAFVVGGSSVIGAVTILHGIELPRARWGGNDLARHLERFDDEGLLGEIERMVEERRHDLRRIEGSAGAIGLGTTFDGWSRRTSPVIVYVRNSSDEPARPMLTLACRAPREHRPVRGLIADRNSEIEVVFDDETLHRVRLEAIAPGASAAVLVRANRAWPGRERRPRLLGIGIKRVDFEPLTAPR